MDRLTSIHNKSIIMYVLFPLASIALTFGCAFVLHIWLPFELVGSVALLGVLISAIMKFRLWINRYELLDDSILKSNQARVIFCSIPAEVVFWMIAMGFLLLGD